MAKELIICGFHRSGTSVLAKELHDAGLFLGRNLMKAALSNRDGHFEDYRIVTLHEEIYRRNGCSWRCDSPDGLAIDEELSGEMAKIVSDRGAEHAEWGFKDPRVVLLMREWYEKMNDPHTVAVYRHYESSINSLLHRSAMEYAYGMSDDISLWRDTTLACRMWLNTNRRVVEHIREYPERTLLVSHEAFIGGYPIIREIDERFGFHLDRESPSVIRSGRISPLPKKLPIPDNLAKEMEELWREMESLSHAPSNKAPVRKKSHFSDTDIEKIFDALSIPGPVSARERLKVATKIVEKATDIEILTDILSKDIDLFFESGTEKKLLETLERIYRLDPTDERTVRLYCDISVRAGRDDIVSKIAQENPDFAYPSLLLAGLKIEKGDIDGARRIVESLPTDSPNLIMRARIAQSLCRYDDAIFLLDEAVAMQERGEPDRDIVLEALRLKSEIIYFRLENPDMLSKHFEYFKREYPDRNLAFDLERWMNESHEMSDEEARRSLENIKRSLHGEIGARLRLTERLERASLSDEAYFDIRSRIANHLKKLLPEQSISREEIRKRRRLYTFTIDSLPKHYLQAEILLMSLSVCGGVKREDIVVNCTSRVDKEFISWLEEEGYGYRTIRPYLDGKYCNKIEAIANLASVCDEYDSIVALDSDMFVSSPIPYFDDADSVVYAKRADAPNPSIETIENIFEKAEVDTPPKAPTDFDIREAEVPENYFNGGFYSIPTKHLERLCAEWKRHAVWLHDTRELFRNSSEEKHIDQISFALALVTADMEYRALSANFNCPIHRRIVPSSLDEEKPIMVLHYHDTLGPFGIRPETDSDSTAISDAVAKANDIISRNSPLKFYENFRVSEKVVPCGDFTSEKRRFSLIAERAKSVSKIILHCGTPKTGTTSIQFFLDDNYDSLLERGILYPKVQLETYAPKHQWIIPALRREDFDHFLDKLEEVIDETRENTDTIFLSTEGIYNHWRNFSSLSKSFLKLLNDFFDIEIWVWFREPLSFMRSLYRQNIKNIRVDGFESYGSNLTFDEMMDDRWFESHLDYLGFLLDMEELFGRERLNIFHMERDVLSTLTTSLRIDNLPMSRKRENRSLGCTTTEIVRELNALRPDNEGKKRIIDNMYELEKVISAYENGTVCPPEPAERIAKAFSLQKRVLEERYSLSWRESGRKTLCIVVLGMHRSGTSSLMGTLEAMGIFAGDVSSFNPHNRKGNREHPDIVKLDDELLSLNGGSWREPVDVTVWNDALRQRRDSVIESLISEGASVIAFKDPRSLFTLDFWIEGLEKRVDIALLGTFRHPASTAGSLMRRDAMPKEEGISIWKRYNEKLLEIYRKKPFPIVSFDMDKDAYIESVERAVASLGIHPHSGREFFDEKLRHFSGMEKEISDAEALTLYLRLRSASSPGPKRRRLSVVVNFYNMRREAERTLYTLSPEYQGVDADEYEVIAIDNGSRDILGMEMVESFGDNFRYVRFSPSSPSPVEAINAVVRSCESHYVLVLIDGARMLSPCILKHSLSVSSTTEHPFIYTIGMHLGPKVQNISMTEGYDRDTEDRLLADIDWREDGYRLFDISSTALSSRGGYFATIHESNCFMMRRDDYLSIGGYCEKFRSPGGGLCNHDIFRRVMENGSFTPILLLGEATFHQIHGGVATNVPMQKHPFAQMEEEYISIRGERYAPYEREPLYYGRMRKSITITETD